MKSTFFSALSVSLLLALAPGCSKKEETPAPPAASSAETPAPAQTAPSTERPQAAPARAAATVDARGALNAVDAALKARQYEEAAQAMLAVQAQKLTEQQADAARGQMVRLQREIAGALASGDPKAKAAAEMLRRSSTVH